LGANHFFLNKGIKAMGLANKIENTEKRRQVRHKCEGIIEWSYFNRTVNFAAKLLNFSEGGIYFETGHDLKPGATIFLKMNMVSSSKINSLYLSTRDQYHWVKSNGASIYQEAINLVMELV
jgi:Tfp pilus assembly protein PilZ